MKRGFTLIELLCVIIIISFLLLLSIPGLTSVYNQIKRDNYQSKVSYINNTAYKYSMTIKDEIKQSGCIDTNVADLIKKGYLDSEKKNKDVIINPQNNQYMDGTIKMCYSKKKLDVLVFYVTPFNEHTIYYVDDIVSIYDKIYRCNIKYNNNGGINSTKNGKNYFELIEF